MSYLPVDPQSAVSLFMHGDPSGYKTGMGAYDRVGDWTWEYNGPNAFAFLDPADSAPQPAPHLPDAAWGLGDCGCGGKCGGCGGHKHGMGQGLLNTGLLSSTDFSTWTWQDYAMAAIVVFGGISVINSVLGVGKSARSTYRGIQRAQKRKARAQAFSTLDTL